MICVFDVVDGPAKGKRFWIRLNEKFEVGRISTADFSIPSDPQMSRHHLILEGRLTGFRVRDVGSTNGTFVNDAKISSIDLCDGDQIKAGDSVFDVSILQTASPPEENAPTDSGTDSHVESSSAESDSLPSLDSDGDSTSRCHSEVVMDQTYRNQHTSLDLWKGLGFDRMPSGVLLSQAEGPETPTPLGLTKVLERLSSEFTVQAFVQVEPLRRFETELLSRFGVDENELRQPCVVLADVADSPEFRVFAEGLLSRNALVLAGYYQQDAPDPSDLTNRYAPHELEALAADTTAISKDLFDADCAWLLFEQAKTERLQVIDFCQN